MRNLDPAAFPIDPRAAGPRRPCFRPRRALLLALLFVPLLGEQLSGDRCTAAEPEKYVPTPEQLRQGYQRAGQRGPSRGRVYKDRVAPHWFADNKRFWYRNDLPGGAREF